MANGIVRIIPIASLALAGCASGSLEGERTVFNNPYAPPVIDRTGIGPKCELGGGNDATCLGVPLTRRGRGNTIGAPVVANLTRNQRRILREQAELLRTPRQPPALPVPPPVPSAPPIADDTESAEAP